jgi:hypothetical protein
VTCNLTGVLAGSARLAGSTLPAWKRNEESSAARADGAANMVNSAKEATAVALMIVMVLEVTKSVAPEIENDSHLQDPSDLVKRGTLKRVIAVFTSCHDMEFVDYGGNDR